MPLADSAISERIDGQVEIDLLPADWWDRVLYRGWRARVRLDPAVRRQAVWASLGGVHTKPDTANAAVAVVLGAGNVLSIVLLDLAHKLFVEGHVAIAKFNPVNEYIGPFVEHTYGDLIDEGVVRTCYGGVDVGEYLVQHEGIDEIHVTGSEQSHDAIVFGTGMEGAARKAAGTPLIDKRITSELGNVSPVVVAPGRWSRRQIAHQAEHVATQLLQNAGYNCNAAKVLVVPEAWDQAGRFLGAIGECLSRAPGRPPYYPGSKERYDRVLADGGLVRTYGSAAQEVPPTMIEVDAGADHVAFREEAFCRLMAVVRLPGDDADGFLSRATAFCNERLRGSLNVTVLIDPATADDHRPAVERTIDRLRYGTVGVNLWAAGGFGLGVTPWGAYPGHTLDDVGSGIGFVHNARLIDTPQKTVISAPFVMVPRPAWSVFHGRSTEALRRGTRFEARPSVGRLLSVVTAGVRS